MKQKIHGAEWLYIPLVILLSLNNHCPDKTTSTSTLQETTLKFQTVVGIWRPRSQGFQVTGMIEWSQKSRPKKIPRASSKTQKNP